MRCVILKTVSLLFIFLVLLFSSHLSCNAKILEDKYIEGDWIYQINDNASLYNKYNHTNETSVAVITGYQGKQSNVTVPSKLGGYFVESVMNLGESNTLREVEVSNGILRITEKAFSNCTNLEKLSCRNVRYIGKHAFKGCKKLSKLYATGEKIFIDDYAFRDTSLTTVLLPSEYALGTNAFPPQTTKTTNFIEYFQMRIIRLFPYQINSFSVPFIISIEVILLIIILYFTKQLFDIIFSKLGFTTYHDYRKYCKQNRSTLKETDSINIELNFQKRKKRFPFLYYFSLTVFLLILIFIIWAALGQLADILDDLIVTTPIILRILMRAFVVIIGFVIIIFICYRMYCLFIKIQRSRTRIHVKKYKKGDKGYDS